MDARLRELVEANRYKVPSEERMDAKLRSFAYGNLALEEPGTSREAIDAAVDAMTEASRRGVDRLR